MTLFSKVRASIGKASLPIKFALFTSTTMVGMYFVNTYIGFIGPLNGPSMNPTINTEGDIAVVSISKRYNLGDVVVAKDGPSRLLCKRIRAIEGEVVTLQHESGQIDNVVVPPNHVWLQGDNPAESRDSRSFGTVPVSNILGRVVCRFSFTNSPHFEMISKTPKKVK